MDEFDPLDEFKCPECQLIGSKEDQCPECKLCDICCSCDLEETND